MSLFKSTLNAVSPSSIDDFKSSIVKHGGLARGNRFAVFVTPPSASLFNLDLENIASNALSGTFNPKNLVNDPRDIALLCVSASLPGRQITTIEHQDSTITTKRPNGYLNEDVSFTFHLTNDYYIKKIFDRWQDSVINRDSYHARYKESYVSDIVIQQLNSQNVPIYGVKLKNAFPVTINAVELSNESENSFQKLTVTVSYDDFEREGEIKTILSGFQESLGGLTNTLTNFSKGKIQIDRGIFG